MSDDSTSECPTCHETDYLMASVPDDLTYSLDAGGGVVFVTCNGCGDRLSFTVEATRSRISATDETADGATCPDCGETNILVAELSPDSLIQLESGYVLFDVECMGCHATYTVETTVENITVTS